MPTTAKVEDKKKGWNDIKNYDWVYCLSSSSGDLMMIFSSVAYDSYKRFFFYKILGRLWLRSWCRPVAYGDSKVVKWANISKIAQNRLSHTVATVTPCLHWKHVSHVFDMCMSRNQYTPILFNPAIYYTPMWVSRLEFQKGRSTKTRNSLVWVVLLLL